MNVFQVFHSMVSPESQAVRDHLVLRNGQIVNATLMDMFANGDAKIAIQGYMVRAKLETPMARGEHTFMQVQSFQNGIVVMKLLAPNEANAPNVPDNNINQLLKNTELPQNAAWREVIQQMMQRNIPLLPDILQNGVALLGKQPTANQLQTWFTMLERGIPISADSLQAVHQLLYGSSVNTLVNELKALVQQLLAQSQGNTGTSAQQSASQQSISQQSASESSQMIQDSSVTGARTAQTAAGAEARTQPIPGNIAEQVANAKSSVQQQLASNLIEQSNSAGRAAADAGSLPVQTSPVAGENTQMIGQLLKLSQVLDEISQTAKQVVRAENNAASAVPSTSQESPLAQLLKLFGYQHEKQAANLLQNRAGGMEKAAETVEQAMHRDGNATLPNENAKQLLIQLSANPQYPQAVREMAQQLLNNITGQQLLSLPQDQQTMHQSIMVQIPVEWGENQQDTLTLQVQGRKDKKTIDPSNCSIYLDLHPPNLGDLGVFVHIVSKVVSVKLFSENQQIKPMAAQLFPLLKQGLSEQGYLLSFVRVEEAQQETKTHKAINAYGKTSAKGIDIRV